MKKLLSLFLMGSTLVPHGAQAAWYDWNESGKLIAAAAAGCVGTLVVGGVFAGLWAESKKIELARVKKEKDECQNKLNAAEPLLIDLAHNLDPKLTIKGDVGKDGRFIYKFMHAGLGSGSYDLNTCLNHKQTIEKEAQKKQIVEAVQSANQENDKLRAELDNYKKAEEGAVERERQDRKEIEATVVKALEQKIKCEFFKDSAKSGDKVVRVRFNASQGESMSLDAFFVHFTKRFQLGDYISSHISEFKVPYNPKEKSALPLTDDIAVGLQQIVISNGFECEMVDAQLFFESTGKFKKDHMRFFLAKRKK
ncbi:MAG: hypothetical protein WC707_04235 [Candidatus Babeliaceae bacterium]